MMRQIKITGNTITKRDTTSIDKYINDISRISTLVTQEEEVKLAQRIKLGDEEAKKTLVLANLRFVVSVSKKYQNQNVPLIDLISEGNIGLLKAAERFDETRGFKFISYAVWWIRQSIMECLNNNARSIRIPLNKINSISKLNQLACKLEQDLERTPDISELADAMDESNEEIFTLMNCYNRVGSLDKAVGDDGGATIADLIPDKNNDSPVSHLEKESVSQDINRSMKANLAPREIEILTLSFGLNGGEPLTLEEIGHKFDLTRERVRQIKMKALRRLKIRSKKLIYHM